MRLETLQLRIDDHAYERYCQRVEQIDREALSDIVIDQLQQGYRRKKGYIQIGAVWWRSSKDGNTITLHTCYGRHHIDIPEAIKWAKRNKDRIDLGHGN